MFPHYDRLTPANGLAKWFTAVHNQILFFFDPKVSSSSNSPTLEYHLSGVR